MTYAVMMLVFAPEPSVKKWEETDIFGIHNKWLATCSILDKRSSSFCWTTEEWCHGDKIPVRRCEVPI